MQLFSALTHRRQRSVALTFAALIALALIGWAAASRIRSPAQVAADTAPPAPSAITVPVVKRTLSTEVIVRGTVRYGAPQSVALGTSKVKQGSGIVTRAPQPRATLRAGSVAMSVDGRPVFVLPGAIPMHRDLHPGDSGPDVRQLERALAGLGLHPGRVDGRFDRATAAAVSSFYLRRGWDPMGPTDTQLEQLRTAESTAAQARDTHLQAINTLDQALAQARVDAGSAQRNLDSAIVAAATARQKLAAARAAARAARDRETVAKADSRRDRANAQVDVTAKRNAFKAAIDNQELARARYNEVPPGADASEAYAAAAELRQAGDEVHRARVDLTSALTAQKAVRATALAAVRRAHSDAVLARRDIRVAASDARRAQRAVGAARAIRTSDTSALKAIVSSDAREARRTQADVSRLVSQSRVQVPADEVVFLPSLPLRVDTALAKRGSAITGPVMRVTNSLLAIDSSLESSDHQLVRLGNPVTIEEQDLGVTAHGVVSQVADTPGTNRVDPSRFYMAVVPGRGFPSLVGTSVKLTIAVKSTRGAVLAVPPSALSVGGDGNSRVQVRRNGRTELVKVLPGLAAENLVEVRPAAGERLGVGDLVIVGRGNRGP